jgi:hypothetical protein
VKSNDGDKIARISPKFREALIWASASATAGWSVALERAVKEFNRATHTRKLALRFELQTRESDAQVKFGIGKPEDFRLSTHGTTSLSSIEQSGEILKADILVHPKPQVWAPRKKQGSKEYEQVQRDAGDGVRLVIIAHEFVHACGLENIPIMNRRMFSIVHSNPMAATNRKTTI